MVTNPFDVRKLMADCVETHRPAARAKGIAISWTVDSGVPERVTGDPLRIRQMVSNLLSNGVKFTGQGEVRLAVTAESVTDRTLELRISVADTGAGISVEMLPTLHGGGVQVESAEGKGSTFRISLLCECSGHEAQASTAASGVRVLVAEDNLINQKLVTAILRKKGYEPVVANNGFEALEQLRGAPTPDYFAIVLMDVQMPMMDGLQATRAIRGEARWIDLPIVAVTAHAMAGDRDRCLQAGMNGYISKPVNSAHLIATVERYIRQGDRSERAAAAARIDAEPQRREPIIMAGNESAPQGRIAAGGVSECTREVTQAATEGDYGRVHKQLSRLSDQIAALQNTVPTT